MIHGVGDIGRDVIEQFPQDGGGWGRGFDQWWWDVFVVDVHFGDVMAGGGGGGTTTHLVEVVGWWESHKRMNVFANARLWWGTSGADVVGGGDGGAGQEQGGQE